MSDRMPPPPPRRLRPAPSPKPQPDGHPSLVDIDQRLTNVERILLDMQAAIIPKKLRIGGWVTIMGSVLGIAIKIILGS
jgi:hypothetical protein